jgi:hypothetical protein
MNHFPGNPYGNDRRMAEVAIWAEGYRAGLEAAAAVCQDLAVVPLRADCGQAVAANLRSCAVHIRALLDKDQESGAD